MKSTLILLILLALISCGPKRMSCGARGICETSTKNDREFSTPASYQYVYRDSPISTKYRLIQD